MRHNKQSGFTLVEIMVTLLIMSLMMVAITQVLQGARRTRDLVNNIQESQLAGPAILDLIESDLRGLYTSNRYILDVLSIKDDAISGMDADRIDFVTSSNSRLLTPNQDGSRFLKADFNEVGYCVKTNLDYAGDFLEIWRREGFGVDEEPFQDGKFTFLHDRVRRFDIQIFNEEGSDAEPIESWGIPTADETFRGLPTRIEIELELELAPRLINEQSTRISTQKRRVLYRRVIHFPTRHHLALNIRPVPRIPQIEPVQPGGGQGNGSSSSPDGLGSSGQGSKSGSGGNQGNAITLPGLGSGGDGPEGQVDVPNPFGGLGG